MNYRKDILRTALLVTAMLTGVSCLPTGQHSFVERAAAGSGSQDRSAAVFRKDKASIAKLPTGTEVFAQASTPARSIFSTTGARKPAPVKEPELKIASRENTAPVQNIPSMVGSNLLVRTTAYCHKETDSLPYGRLNAAGGILQYGSTIRSAAADWSRFPLGTKFRIEGQPYEYVIDDYGSALVGTNTIDIYKPTISAMNDWGVRRVPIQIIEWGCFHKSRDILDGRKHVQHAEHVRQMLHDIESRYIHRHSTASRMEPTVVEATGA